MEIERLCSGFPNRNRTQLQTNRHGHDVLYENNRLRQQFENIAKESKTFAAELVALNDDHKITAIVVERKLVFECGFGL